MVEILDLDCDDCNDLEKTTADIVLKLKWTQAVD
jgi:hypothetical protein